MHLFLATDMATKRLYAEDTAAITVVRVPKDEIPGLIASGEIQDAKSVAALLQYLGGITAD